MTSLPDNAKALIDTNLYVTVGTIRSDGSPQLSVVWVERDGDDILFSTVVGRAKERNLRRDPRINVSFFDPANPFTYYAVEGIATMTEDGAAEAIQRLAQKYIQSEYTADKEGDVRVVVRVSADKVIGQ